MEELREFGLTENECKIYLKLLQLGPSNPAKLAEQTGFSRPYVYDALERMLEKEIVSTILKNNKKNYIATDPKRIEELEIKRLERLQNIIPKLEALKNIQKDDIKVEVHRGTYVYKTLLNDIITTLKKDDEVLIFGFEDSILINSDKYYFTYLKQYFSKIKKLNIKEKMIARKGGVILKEAKSTEYRFLPEEAIGNTGFEVYGNKVAIFLWGTPNHLILIESEEVAKSYRYQFKILWEQAKEPGNLHKSEKRVVHAGRT